MNFNKNINYNDMNYYSPNVSKIGKTKNIYGSMKPNTNININRKSITAN